MGIPHALITANLNSNKMIVKQTNIPEHIKHCFSMRLRLIMLYRTFLFLLTGNMRYMFFTVEGGLRFSLDRMNKSKAEYWIITKNEGDPDLHKYEGTVRGFDRTVNGKPVVCETSPKFLTESDKSFDPNAR